MQNCGIAESLWHVCLTRQRTVLFKRNYINMCIYIHITNVQPRFKWNTAPPRSSLSSLDELTLCRTDVSYAELVDLGTGISEVKQERGDAGSFTSLRASILCLSAGETAATASPGAGAGATVD